MHRNNQSTQLTRMITIAALVGLIILLGLTPIGMINVGIIYITFLCIPVLIGTFSMGLNAGLILGFAMGCVSFYKGVRAPAAMVAPILGQGIGYLILLCYLPRLLIPVVGHSTYTFFKKKIGKKSLPLAAILGSLTNTICYLGLILVLYSVLGLQDPTLLGAVGTITLTAGIPEAIACAIVATPIIIALEKSGLLKRLQ